MIILNKSFIEFQQNEDDDKSEDENEQPAKRQRLISSGSEDDEEEIREEEATVSYMKYLKSKKMSNFLWFMLFFINDNHNDKYTFILHIF